MSDVARFVLNTANGEDKGMQQTSSGQGNRECRLAVAVAVAFRHAMTLCCCVTLCVVFAAQHNAMAEEKTKSLDEQLFDSLDDDLFSDLAPIPAEVPAKTASELDRALQRQLGGEDQGQRRSANPLEQVTQEMDRVRKRLSARDTQTETQLMQAGIVDSFEQMIAELKQQQKKKQQQKQNQSQQQQKQQQKQKQSQQSKPSPKPGQGKPQGNSNSNNAAKESTTQLGNAENQAADADDRDRMMQAAWGNLPSAVRQQFQSARPEKFLPKYSRLIEDYFKRLAEEKKK